MSPEELQTTYLCIASFVIVIIAIAIGYGAGYTDGRASRDLWTEEELKDKLNSN